MAMMFYQQIAPVRETCLTGFGPSTQQQTFVLYAPLPALNQHDPVASDTSPMRKSTPRNSLAPRELDG